MLIVYLYDHQWNPLTQLFAVQRFECTQTLNSYDQARFVIPSTHQDNTLSKLKLFNEVKVSHLKAWKESCYIHGIIHSVEASLTQTVVTIRSFERLFEKKLISSDATYTNQSLVSIISWLLATINARYDTGIILNCSLSDTIDLSVTKGATFASVLQEIVKLGYQYRVLNKLLCIDTRLWTDRTTGENYYQLKRDVQDPLERNIAEASITNDAWQLTNSPFEKSVWFQIDQESIDTYGRVEETISADGNATVALQETLTSKASGARVLELSPIVQDFFAVSIWDLLAVHIDAGNEIMNYTWSVQVLQKIQDTRGVVRLTVSSSTTRIPTLLETIREHDKLIKKLETS